MGTFATKDERLRRILNFLISDGQSPFRGWPFFKRINKKEKIGFKMGSKKKLVAVEGLEPPAK